jgi:3-oxoacyl-[acyl-carrier-protein] synthase-3
LAELKEYKRKGQEVKSSQRLSQYGLKRKFAPHLKRFKEGYEVGVNMLYVHGMGHFHPENVIDNAFLVSLDIGTDEQWIMQHVGIRTRRTVLPLDYIYHERNKDRRAGEEAALYKNEDTGERAAHHALERAGLKPSDIGLVIAGSSAPASTSPPEACQIAYKLDICAPAFDICSACSTFIAQLRTLELSQPDKLPEFILIITPENLTRVVNYSDRSAAVLMGDCTTAAIVSTKVAAPLRVSFTILESNPLSCSKVVIPSTGYLKQDGPAVQIFAIKKITEIYKRIAQSAVGSPFLVGNQANLMMLREVCERAGVSVEKHLYNVDEFGHCGAAGSASVVSQYWDDLKDGDEICLAVAGAGLSWGGALLRSGMAEDA